MLITSTHTNTHREMLYVPISTCTGILTCSSPYAAHSDDSPHSLLTPTHTDLHMQIQNCAHTQPTCSLHTHSNTLIQRNSGCKQMNRRPFSCTDLHMRNHLMHTCMSLNTHTHYSVLFSMPGRHVHISCSFSFVIRASAHESPLSLSSSPRSLPFYSLSLPRLPRSLSI